MGFGIGEAVKQLQNGAKVAREGWNGKGMWLCLNAEPATAKDPDGVHHHVSPHVLMKPAGTPNMVPWLCSQTDLLATDWVIIEG